MDTHIPQYIIVDINTIGYTDLVKDDILDIYKIKRNFTNSSQHDFQTKNVIKFSCTLMEAYPQTAFVTQVNTIIDSIHSYKYTYIISVRRIS